MNFIKKYIDKRSPTEHTVIKNTGWLFIGEIGSRIIRGTLAIIAARMLGVSGLGEWSYVIALGGFLTFFEDAGIALFVTREFAKDSEEKESVFATALVLKILLLTIAVSIFLIVGPIMSSIPTATKIIPVVGMVLFFDSLRSFFFSVSRAQEKMHIESAVQIVTNTLVVIFGVTFMALSPTPLSLAFGYAFGGGIGCLIMFLSIRTYIPNIKDSFSKELFLHIFKSAWPFTILATSNIINFSADTLLLGHFSNAQEVGWYSAGSRLVQMLYILPVLFATGIFPVLVKKSQGPDGFRSALKKAVQLMLIIVIPLVLVLIFGSHIIITILFGKAYDHSATILAIMSLSCLPVFIGAMYNNAIYALNEQKKFVVANVIGMVANVILSLVLIPRFHAIGAASATVLALSITALITLVIFKKLRS